MQMHSFCGSGFQPRLCPPLLKRLKPFEHLNELNQDVKFRIFRCHRTRSNALKAGLMVMGSVQDYAKFTSRLQLQVYEPA